MSRHCEPVTGLSEGAERASIAVNHSQMCKFTSKEQDGFKLILWACRRYIQEAGTIINIRWHKDRNLLDEERKEEAVELLHRDSGLSIRGPPSPIRNVHFVVSRSASSLFTGREDTANMLRHDCLQCSDARGTATQNICSLGTRRIWKNAVLPQVY